MSVYDTAPARDAVLGDFWAYPLRYGDRLQSFDWMPLYVERLLSSRFVASAIYEGRRQDIGTALLLWSASLKQNPAGTLPDDDIELAQLARFGADVDGWREARDGALYGWRAVHIDDAPPGEGPRLAHPLIAEIAEEQFRRKRGRERGREVAAWATMKSRVRSKLREAKHGRIAGNDYAVEQIASWIRDSDLYVTSENVRVAMETVLGTPKVVAMNGEGI
ncbi:DUF1376 domain-containing protein [Paracoccus sp. CPCC 101403]|uniref:DUF1376 domain-containing protein n=1 Tax=Paracoccus broussonetiae TaxID=3075834 RepID=A0ABU3ECD4_9RHOB|nr:DUF1376 domain-containing protein [Paracoccus sp. CPCC 101403]MDT1061888.1 DUF1376 domain-containing protein [Paracoccus sp. CPCC 101403]